MFNLDKQDRNMVTLIFGELILALAGLFYTSPLIIGGQWGLVVAMIIADRKERTAAQLLSPSFWWFIIYPVYLFKRDGIDGRKRRPLFLLWLASLAVAVVVSTGIELSKVKSSEQTAQIETRTCEIVDKIMRENNIEGNCVKTMSMKQVDDTDLYKGTVLITNGNEVQVTSTIQDNGERLYVHVNSLNALR